MDSAQPATASLVNAAGLISALAIAQVASGGIGLVFAYFFGRYFTVRGTLALTATNTYSGGTNLNGGILAVITDFNLGTGALSFNGGTLEVLADSGGINSNKAITLNARQSSTE